MNCTDIQNQTSDYLSRSLEAAELEAFQHHIDGCDSCREIVDEEQRLIALLKQVPVRGPSEDFYDRALQMAVKPEAHEHHRLGFIKGFGTAVAASLALWILVGVLPVSQEPGTQKGQGITIAVQEVKTVKLAFHTVGAMDNARITIQLPENVELVGYTGRRELAWNTNLKKGDNILKLPIRANAMTKGKILAKIEHKKQVRTIMIDLDVTRKGMTMEQKTLTIV